MADPTEGPTIQRSVTLPKNLDDALRSCAKKEDRPISRVVRRALLLYLGYSNDNHETSDDGQEPIQG